MTAPSHIVPAALAATAFLAGTQGAVACEAGSQGLFGSPLKQEANCSFDGAGKGRWEVGHGGPAIDIGGAKVGQRYSFGGSGCSVEQSLVVIDCGSKKSAMFDGQEDPDGRIAGGYFTSIKQIQPPHGPIALTPDVDISALVTVARKNGIGVEQDLEGFVKKLGVFNRIDPYCGCKIFYPDSAGAQ